MDHCYLIGCEVKNQVNVISYIYNSNTCAVMKQKNPGNELDKTARNIGISKLPNRVSK